LRTFAVATIFLIVGPLLARAEQLDLSKVIKASIVFRAETDQSHPHVLRVYLVLENLHDSDVTWVSNKVEDVEAELIDSDGRQVAQSSSAASVGSNSTTYLLPYGSRLEWMISHGGINVMAEAKNKYLLSVGGKAWLLPVRSISSYSIRIRLKGKPWGRHPDTILLDIPVTPITIIQ
jgi:hypothetical protein